MSSTDFAAKWKDFAHEIGVQVTALFFQHITDNLRINAIMKDKFGVSQHTCDNDDLPDLTYEEQNAVHYMLVVMSCML